jgi:hypothetical protein
MKFNEVIDFNNSLAEMVKALNEEQASSLKRINDLEANYESGDKTLENHEMEIRMSAGTDKN